MSASVLFPAYASLVPFESDMNEVKDLPIVFDAKCVICGKVVEPIGEMDVVVGECCSCGQSHRMLDRRAFPRG